MRLALDIGLAGFPLGIERVEFEIEIMLGRFAGVDRAALGFGTTGFMICAPRHEEERQRICRSDVVPRRPAVAWFLAPGKDVARWALPATRRLLPVKPRPLCRSGDQKSAGRSTPYR